MKKSITEIINNNNELTQKLADLADKIEVAAKQIIKTYNSGGKVLLFGNGGSAADAQHLATELVVRFYKNRAALPAIALSTNGSILTAAGNDASFEEVFKRQIEALTNKNDCVIAISTSGNSPNIISAARKAKDKNCFLISLTGENKTELSLISDICLAVPSSDTPRIQEAHILIGHIICQLVEEALFEAGVKSEG